MKWKLLIVATLLCFSAADALARKKHRARALHPPPARTHKAHRPRTAMARDEVRLSASLERQLEAHLVGGGYLDRIDGRLGPRTRHALVAFQREYHLRPTGAVDVATADALLGRDQIAASIIR